MPKRQSGNKKGKQSNFAKLSIFQPNKYKFKKTCPLSGKGAPAVDYKNVRLLKKYMSENGKILPSRITNVSQKKQREIIDIDTNYFAKREDDDKKESSKN